MNTLDESNAALRQAVGDRLAGTPANDPKMIGYEAGGCCDGGRCHTPPRSVTLRPGSLAFMKVLDEISAIHVAKSQDYGADDDALANIRSGADLIGVEPWRACLIRMADKMTRLRSFCHRGRVEFDGVEDTLLDMAAYCAIALVLYREQNNGRTLPGADQR
jgi:hypothetical protein